MYDFRKMRVWHSAKDVCLAVYDVTAGFPRHETYGMASQMRRAARSIAANIAEGSGYRGRMDSARFYEMSIGSSSECLSDLLIARELHYVSTDEFQRLDGLLSVTRPQLIRLVERSRSRQ